MKDASPVIETIIDTLLQVGDRVIEVSSDHIICSITDRDSVTLFPDPVQLYIGNDISLPQRDNWLPECAQKIDACFRTRQSEYITYFIDGSPCALRILPAHPNKNRVLLLIESLRKDALNTPQHGNMLHDSITREQMLLQERILNNIYADIVVLDAQYRFLYISPASVRDEETRKWLIGRTDEEFFIHRNKPLTIAQRRKKMYDSARNERHMIEWIEKTEMPTGGIKSILRRIYPVFDEKGGLEVIIGYSMNVTDMMVVQEELKTSRDIFLSAFHDSGIGMALLGPDGKWLDVNKVICDMLGYTKEELMRLKIQSIVHPDEWEMDRMLVQKMLYKEIPNFTMERRYISRLGETISVLLTLTMVCGNDDNPKFFVAQAVDISFRKELENMLSRKNHELESTKVKLTNKVGQLEELSYIIAHNLRGPAGNIKTLAECLLSSVNTPVEDSQPGPFSLQEGLHFINEASESLMNSLSSMMQIAQIKLNNQIPRTSCDIEAVVNEVTMQLQNDIVEKQAGIHLSLDVRVITYPKPYLESILYNFISNALKYSKPGVPPNITIATYQTNEGVQLSVKDNGLGIDMGKYKDKIFKLNQTFHSGYDSKGFGLYLTKTQVESLGGRIVVESTLDEGTEFIVTI